MQAWPDRTQAKGSRHQPARGGNHRGRNRAAGRPASEGAAGERPGCRGARAQGRLEGRAGAGKEVGEEEAQCGGADGGAGKVGNWSLARHDPLTVPQNFSRSMPPSTKVAAFFI